jgi:HD-GYP domain-containing protein (c-di-GMP phosphodiesterase class II)
LSAPLPQLHIDQLQPGLFIALELAWLEHPFPVNSFLLKDEAQVRTLRELGLSMVSFDPLRSLVQPRAMEGEPGPGTAPAVSSGNRALMEAKRTRTGRMVSHRERILSFEHEYEQTMAATREVHTEIFRHPQHAVALAASLSEALTSTFLDDQGATVMMVSSNKVDDLSLQHALNVMILTMVIGKGLNLSREIMTAAGVGALLHDIGKTSISKTVLRKSPRNRSEETLYRLHGEYGVGIVGTHVNPGVRAIIRQHHEYVDGSGFPDGSKGAQINPLARLVAIADRYDTLCNPLRLADALPPAEAVSIMYALEAHLFDTAMLAVFIRELGIYPPGSFVRLSNGSIALVIAASPGHALRPSVLIYEPGVPRSEAVVINLTESPDVKIESVLKPASLEHEVIDYLNPRMRLAYHPLKIEV